MSYLELLEKFFVRQIRTPPHDWKGKFPLLRFHEQFEFCLGWASKYPDSCGDSITSRHGTRFASYGRIALRNSKRKRQIMIFTTIFSGEVCIFCSN